MRSKGSLDLRALGTGIEIAARLGKSESLISHWLAGRKVPSVAMKKRIEELGGPTADSWDVYAAIPTVVSIDDDDEELLEPTADEVRSLAARLMKTAKDIEGSLAQETSAYDRLRTLEKLTGIVVDLGKLTGASVLNERMILQSPGFKRLLARILEAIETLPAETAALAMRAVAAKMKEFE